MNVSEIVDELRTRRPRASEPLRVHVLTVASQPAPTTAPRLARLRVRRVVLLVPAAAGLAVASAIAIGVTRPEPALRDAASSPPSTAERNSAQDARTAGPTTSESYSGAQDATALAGKAAPGPVGGRAQRYVASLTLAVQDTDALSAATQRALSIARDLGGYVVAVRYATGDDGVASVTLRVPSGRSADAVTRLSALGTIVAQDVQIDDLQQPLDELDRTLRRLQAQLAAVKAKLGGPLTSAERARLEERRAQLKAELDRHRANQAAIAAEARLATFQLELRTKEDEGVTPPGSRLDRALDKALVVLTWEAVVALAILVAGVPLVLVGVAVWLTHRTHRRRSEERLLGAS
jgi:hypothetical protein